MSNTKIVVLGTGGTIAGLASQPGNALDYTAAAQGVEQLLTGLQLPGIDLVSEQVAQIDSKDMVPQVWQQLASRVGWWLAQADVRGLVITHGTDTLEETAYFLHALVQPAKPVVLTCAMRPANALLADGPQNLADAVTVAAYAGAQGVSVVCAGAVHCGLDVQKAHTWKLDAFSSGDAGPLGQVVAGRLFLNRNWPLATAESQQAAIEKVARQKNWPRVEIVMNHAGADGAIVRALVRDGVQGMVVAGTGNGTLHHALEDALLQAQAAGIRVVRASRCAQGRVLAKPSDRLPDSKGLSPVKARIALMLALMD